VTPTLGEYLQAKEIEATSESANGSGGHSSEICPSRDANIEINGETNS
jgi:hypothetical protein